MKLCVVAVWSTPVLWSVGGPADAQGINDNGRLAPVSERARPEYDPIGIRTGGFIAYPTLTSSVEYTDNLFASSNNSQDDTIFVLTPDLRFESQWGRHALNAQVSASTRFHSENDGNDFTDYGGSVDGRLDITRRTSVSANAGYRVGHEERSSPDLPSSAVEPTEFQEVTAGIAINHQFNRLALRPSFVFSSLDFADVALRPPLGGVVNNDDRDRNEWIGGLRVLYEISPALSLFSEASYGQSEYDNNDDVAAGGTVKRDSSAIQGVVGALVDISSLVQGEFAVGYTDTDYEAGAFRDIEGVVADAQLDWLVTDLTTLGFAASREVQETTIDGASGNLVTEVGVSVDHEFLRNLILGAGASYSTSDFEGAGREDEAFSVGMSGTYLVNRNLRVNLQYNYQNRDSNVVGADFDERSVLLSLRTAL
jgi:hypothetical protein